MRRKKYPKGLYWTIFLLLLVISLVVSYWVIYFTTGAVRITEEPTYIAFQEVFPLADAWAAFTATLSLIGILARKNWGFLLGIISGATIIVIGLLDILYNINAGHYALLTSSYSMMYELLLNFLCLTVGINLIWYMWKHRTYFKKTG